MLSLGLQGIKLRQNCLVQERGALRVFRYADSLPTIIAGFVPVCWQFSFGKGVRWGRSNHHFWRVPVLAYPVPVLADIRQSLKPPKAMIAEW